MEIPGQQICNLKLHIQNLSIAENHCEANYLSYVSQPIPHQLNHSTKRGRWGRGGGCQLKTKKTNEMQFPTCSFLLRGPTGPRLLCTRTRPPSSFEFTQPEGGYHYYCVCMFLKKMVKCCHSTVITTNKDSYEKVMKHL